MERVVSLRDFGLELWERGVLGFMRAGPGVWAVQGSCPGVRVGHSSVESIFDAGLNRRCCITTFLDICLTKSL